MSTSQNGGRRAATRAQFFTQIGLREDNEQHLRLFGVMQNEAAAGARRLRAQRGDQNTQVDEQSFRREVLAIYNNSSAETRRLYQAGAVYGDDSSMIDNWVIRWLLWQVLHQSNGQ